MSVHAVVGLGYEGCAIDDFIADLRMREITVLADVRLTPVSRKPGFSKRALAQRLVDAGVQYLHLPELGNPKANRAGFAGDQDAWRSARARYEQLLDTSDKAHSAIRDLASLAHTDNVALLCFEADQRRCHRDILISRLERETASALGNTRRQR